MCHLSVRVALFINPAADYVPLEGAIEL